MAKSKKTSIFGVSPEQKVGKLKRYKAIDLAWVELGDYIIGEGSRKAIKALQGLEGDTYLKHFASMGEFFKPKLTKVDSKTEQQVIINIRTENVLPKKEKKKSVTEARVVSEEALPTNVTTEEVP